MWIDIHWIWRLIGPASNMQYITINIRTSINVTHINFTSLVYDCLSSSEVTRKNKLFPERRAVNLPWIFSIALLNFNVLHVSHWRYYCLALIHRCMVDQSTYRYYGYFLKQISMQRVDIPHVPTLSLYWCRACIGMGNHGRSGFQVWLGVGGYNPARAAAADIRVRSTSAASIWTWRT